MEEEGVAYFCVIINENTIIGIPINNCKNNLVFDEFYEKEFKVFFQISYMSKLDAYKEKLKSNAMS